MNTNRKIVLRLFAIVLTGALIVAFVLFSYQTIHAERALYSGKENHLISLERARRLAEAYQAGAKPGDLTAAYLGRDIFREILDQPACVGIRIYNAVSEAGTPTFVIVGVDGNGNDIVTGPVGEDVIPCPPWCPNLGGLTVIPRTRDVASQR